MTAFFLPGEDGRCGEDAYQGLRRDTEVMMGRVPSRRRISEVWTRRGHVDCVTAVGDPDPISGDVVTAIFDMGVNQPFVVHHRHPEDPERSCTVLGCSVYSVSEFTV